MINISTVVTAMQKELGSFVSTEAHPDMYRYINSAINYIYNRRDWGWNKQVYSFNYLSPLQEQTLPFYPQKVFSVKKDWELVQIANNEEWFTIDDHSNMIWLFSNKVISESTWVYSMLYAKTAPIIVSTDTTIDIPDNFIDVLQMVAIHFAYKDIKDYETAWALIWQANAILDSVTERTVNIHPRNTVRLWSNYTF